MLLIIYDYLDDFAWAYDVLFWLWALFLDWSVFLSYCCIIIFWYLCCCFIFIIFYLFLLISFVICQIFWFKFPLLWIITRSRCKAYFSFPFVAYIFSSLPFFSNVQSLVLQSYLFFYRAWGLEFDLYFVFIKNINFRAGPVDFILDLNKFP